jgi:exodeoxyribonuclease V alpha subunit
MSVHKSQGSEYDRAIVVLPERELEILSRELLYTAVTRARKHVLIVGSEAMLRAAVLRTARRGSGLAERLRG